MFRFSTKDVIDMEINDIKQRNGGNISFEERINAIQKYVYKTQAECIEVFERPLYTVELPMKYPNEILVRDHHGDKQFMHVQCASTDEGAVLSENSDGTAMMVRCQENDPDSVVVKNSEGKNLLTWNLL